MKNKLFLIEGLPCSGQSTTSAFVASCFRQHIPVCFVDESTLDHPADYEFHAFSPAGLVSDKEEIVALSDFSGELFEELLQSVWVGWMP